MFTRSMIVAVVALISGTAMTLPADAKPDRQVRSAVIFWLLDRNNDGAIDRSEVEALRATIFEAVDVDHDGTVTRDEFLEMIGSRDDRRNMRGDHRDDLREDRFAERRQGAVMRMQKGYDHSYFFVATFMPDHVAFHAEALG